MTTDVSCFVRAMDAGDSNESATPGKSPSPVTRDLLGGCCTLGSKELDLDLQVPCGWEKRLDLKSGKVYLQRSNSAASSSSSTTEPMPPPPHDLSLPSTSSKPTSLVLFDDATLDLKLASSSPSNYQSVHTLDKVKSALERAERAGKCSVSISGHKSKSSSPLRSTSSSSVDLDLDREEKSMATIAAGCPSCLLYVLVSRGDPRCPRCNGEVPLPVPIKRPRIDLNISI